MTAPLNILGSLLTPLGLAAALAASSPPTASIDDSSTPTPAAAAAAWKPMAGTPEAQPATFDGAPALRFPCDFTAAHLERASWDRALPLDLSACDGVQFELLCRDASPISYFSLYFQSGEGWYHAAFYPESSDAWNLVRLPKSTFSTEGKPAGWNQIRALRLSAWHARDTSTEFHLRNLRKTGVLGVDARVAVVRAESLARQAPGESRIARRCLEDILDTLRTIPLTPSVLNDLDLTPDMLRPAKVVILPGNPDLPESAAAALTQYARDGGRLLVFDKVPTALLPLLHVQDGKPLAEPSPGFFSSMRFRDPTPEGIPPSTPQPSSNIHAYQPSSADGHVLADWTDAQGKPTGHPAVLGTRAALLVTRTPPSGKPEPSHRWLMGLLGHLAPDLWPHVAQSRLARIGPIETATNFDDAVAAIRALAPNRRRATGMLETARTRRASALHLIDQSRFAAALDEADAASQALQQAWCLAQPSVPGEFRAFWCHSAFGVQGMDWDEAIRRLADNGFNALLPNMLWGGVAHFRSKVLPIAPQLAQRGDPLQQCVAAARKYGVQVHVWKVNWNLGHDAPADFMDRLRQQHRLQADLQGREELWLCPSHPDNQKLEIDSMLEIARDHDVDGLHFDYIRYPDGDHCYCAGCRERFQRALSVTLQTWPKDVQPDGSHHAAWLDWRRSNITAVVRAVSEEAHRLKPALKISAAVFPNWPRDRDTIGQDWKLWCDRGWLDFVCPMDYTSSQSQFDSRIAAQVPWAGRVPCYPGIGASASAPPLGPAGVIRQIQTSRRHQTRGFVIFNYGAAEARDLLPLLGLGITAKTNVE